MSKRHTALGLLIVVVIVGGIVFATTRTDKSASTTAEIKEEDIAKQQSFKFSDLQANYPPVPEACFATTNNPNLKLETADKMAIEDAVLMTVIDIPAGTNADIYFKNYDKTFATGTSIYESTYGSYNFIAQKIPNLDHTNWVVSTFVACKK